MKLTSFGCSFVFGTDLPDEGLDGTGATPSQQTWPARVAHHLGYEYRCQARPGSGNLQILDALLNDIEADAADLYVIGWTWIDRMDCVSESADPWYRPWLGDLEHRRDIRWRTIRPTDTTKESQIYYRHLHSEYTDKFLSLLYAHQALTALRAANRPFIMTYMDDLMFCERWNTSPAVAAMQSQLRPVMRQFQGQNLLTWSKQQGFAISATEHPLADAHQAAADLITDHIASWIQH